MRDFFAGLKLRAYMARFRSLVGQSYGWREYMVSCNVVAFYVMVVYCVFLSLWARTALPVVLCPKPEMAYTCLTLLAHLGY